MLLLRHAAAISGAACGRRVRDRNVDGLRRAQAERVDRRLDLRTVADDEDGQLVGMNVLFRDRGDIGERYFLERRVVGLEIIGRIAVELEPLALGEDLVLGVVAEEERVEDVVLGALRARPR